MKYLNCVVGTGLTACFLLSAAPVMAADCSSDLTSGVSTKRIYYVAPNGTSSNNGNSFNTAMSFTAAMSAVNPGEMILLKPGTYSIPYTQGKGNTITFNKSGKDGAPIYVVTANCGRAVFDFSFPDSQWVQASYGFYVTGDYWYFKGVEVTRAGYQGVYMIGSHNTFENSAFHHNRNTGLEINNGGSYNTVINSDAYRNYDPKKNGSMADGFGPKQKQGPGNRFVGCRAYENSDDGFDLFDSPQKVIIENSWAFRNGINYWKDTAFAGNGNGFKLGGLQAVGNHRITRSVAFDNVMKGFDQNNNAGGVTAINNTSYNNGINYGFGSNLASGQQHYFHNNISLSGKNADSVLNANQQNNTWNNKALLATQSDFVSLDLSLATVARDSDGTLPETGLFRLNSGSKLINAGLKEEGINYSGSAPDLGAFERN
ncbi:right-handed parallel beta-helix repeat-containing protein [Dickeya lacustris]|uniref:Right-handed parallel beta-helix repeat-containing protein n=1 Tax=Dickeya lacustris TaxID=2259638 RepID=A0ABY8G9J1_9GAMM|nr:right-handed parallel beta-helix repeat-containing protein [Dickeya lacustris]WFN56627.1 right-handed parallel beta-helix repeat-containing protein [Dickeya lacustris]